ncbi:hypothetical protein [Calothrix sp. NIES-3974]|uniref:hypothetical protein n=1 Tax=Calothrix sp. NIES-3974 TaxID=2005462 RepID=UPI000B61A88D|nr:hypothetical protein [Calothrix sp. NIES-3974]BAZ05409.1 hypothetical protein NIES3974_20570 [Calothrix sp. NIES-3974]
MNILEITDLSFLEPIAQNSVGNIGGGLHLAGFPRSLSLLEQIKNPVPPDLSSYDIKTVSSDETSVVNKLKNPQTGGIGYEVLSSQGNRKSRALVLLEGDKTGESLFVNVTSSSVAY